ncbi:MAG TPA: Gfo/Idh/MocA family oxidoreductase [Dehalococcoidales bacterium]|nr:Gfo/Idh/MocA family oxidoreductase [Dehalococcoidales bacterium]
MLNVGVVGLGAMGQHHVRLYSELGCRIISVADASLERAREIGEKFKVPYCQDYHSFLKQVDAVTIAVPTSLHHAVTVDFLNAGVHCLVEKPIAFSLEEAEDMIKTADRNRVKLAVGHIERFNPAVARMKEILDSGALGKILTITTRRVGPYVPRIRDVGVVIDSATHDIGVVKYLLGKEPVSLFSRAGSFKHPKEDHAIIIMDFGGTTACLEVNWFTPYKVRNLTVTGSEGIAFLDYIEQSVVVQNSGEKIDGGVKKAEPLRLEVEDFLRCIKEDIQPAVTGAEGRDILRIALESDHNNYCFQLTENCRQ